MSMSFTSPYSTSSTVADLISMAESQVNHANAGDPFVENLIIDLAGLGASALTFSVGFNVSEAMGLFGTATGIPGAGVFLFMEGLSGTIVISDKACRYTKDLVKDLFDQSKETAPIRHDPLLVDLDGDGIETTTLQNGTYFDQDKNGFAQESAWVGADDGVLAFDKNNNGTIDDGGEIFGDNYVLSNSQTATTGFQALADLDSNSDGVINSSDTNFTNIKVLKGDGSLLTLTEAGIASINLTNTATNTIDSSGNTQLRAGSYTKTDTTTGIIGDYSLAQNAMYSVATDWVDVSTEIAELPDVSGYGIVDSLHQAMAKDVSGLLKTFIQSFANTTDIAA